MNMKKSILLLINGFGVEQADSYSVYSADIMPNMDRLTREKIFKTIPNNYLDYKSAYRNFSMGVNDSLTYNLIENNIFKSEYIENPLFKYIINDLKKEEKNKLHIFCYWDSEKTIGQLATYVREISNQVRNKIYIHLVLCQNSVADYKYIDRGMTTIGYDLGLNVKIGIVTGESNFHDNLAFKEIMKSFITEAGEKWKDISKKIEVLSSSNTPPSKARTFAVSYGFGVGENDKILYFNYSNVNITNVRNELANQKYRKLDSSKIQYYSLFPVKADIQVPFMYNFAVSSNYTLQTLKEINARCVVFDMKNKCAYINYLLTGLRNDIDENLKYQPVDDGILYDKDKLIEKIKSLDKELYILNYEIETCKNVTEMINRLKLIDNVIGGLDSLVKENNYTLVISSFYGIQKELYNDKQELCKINFYSKVPVVLDDNELVSPTYSMDDGSLNDLSKMLYHIINKEYKETGLLKKKSNIFSFLYKKGGKK